MSQELIDAFVDSELVIRTYIEFYYDINLEKMAKKFTYNREETFPLCRTQISKLRGIMANVAFEAEVGKLKDPNTISYDHLIMLGRVHEEYTRSIQLSSLKLHCAHWFRSKYDIENSPNFDNYIANNFPSHLVKWLKQSVVDLFDA